MPKRKFIGLSGYQTKDQLLRSKRLDELRLQSELRAEEEKTKSRNQVVQDSTKFRREHTIPLLNIPGTKDTTWVNPSQYSDYIKAKRDINKPNPDASLALARQQLMALPIDSINTQKAQLYKERIRGLQGKEDKPGNDNSVQDENALFSGYKTLSDIYESGGDQNLLPAISGRANDIKRLGIKKTKEMVSSKLGMNPDQLDSILPVAATKKNEIEMMAIPDTTKQQLYDKWWIENIGIDSKKGHQMLGIE
jgi:hypothetical protein